MTSSLGPTTVVKYSPIFALCQLIWLIQWSNYNFSCIAQRRVNQLESGWRSRRSITGYMIRLLYSSQLWYPACKTCPHSWTLFHLWPTDNLQTISCQSAQQKPLQPDTWQGVNNTTTRESDGKRHTNQTAVRRMLRNLITVLATNGLGDVIQGASN